MMKCPLLKEIDIEFVFKRNQHMISVRKGEVLRRITCFEPHHCDRLNTTSYANEVGD